MPILAIVEQEKTSKILNGFSQYKPAIGSSKSLDERKSLSISLENKFFLLPIGVECAPSS